MASNLEKVFQDADSIDENLDNPSPISSKNSSRNKRRRVLSSSSSSSCEDDSIPLATLKEKNNNSSAVKSVRSLSGAKKLRVDSLNDSDVENYTPKRIKARRVRDFDSNDKDLNVKKKDKAVKEELAIVQEDVDVDMEVATGDEIASMDDESSLSDLESSLHSDDFDDVNGNDSMLDSDVEEIAQKYNMSVKKPRQPVVQTTPQSGTDFSDVFGWNQIRAIKNKICTALWPPAQPSTSGYQPPKDLPVNIRNLYKFQRPQHIGNGEILGDEYETQKSLTIRSIKNVVSDLTSRPAADKKTLQPSRIKIPMKPHQLHALNFAIWRESRAHPGGIIGDEMGLGKTIVMISLILSQKKFQVTEISHDKHNHKGGTLIVVPASLIYQWDSEFEKFCYTNALSVCIHHGPDREMNPVYLASLYDVVITSYQLVARAHEARNSLFRIDWDRVILDEGHIIRGRNTLQSRACCELSAKKRWVLTGTPVQNKETDLFTLIKFLRIDPFDEFNVWQRFVATSKSGGSDRLKAILESAMIRRTKKELEDAGLIEPLPEKRIIKLEIKLDPEEQQLHNFFMTFSQAVFSKFLKQRAERQAEFRQVFDDFKNSKILTSLHQKFKALFGSLVVEQHHILVLILRLRQIACHPSLILKALPENLENYSDDEDGSGGDEDFDSEDEEDNGTRRRKKKNSKSTESLQRFDLMKELARLLENEGDSDSDDDGENKDHISRKLLSRKNPVYDSDRESSKIRELMPLIEEKLKGTDKVIIVSTFVGFLDKIGHFLAKRNISYMTYSGKTSTTNRKDILKAINNPESKNQVLLLSMLAGGVGLNLVGANHMFLLDLYWNPQLELQVMDRIHRFGQVKTVTIVKFFCNDTIEEHILGIQEDKLEIARNALDGEKKFTNALSVTDMARIFGMAPVPE